MLPLEKNRLNGDRRTRNNHRQLVGNTTRVGQIGDNETGHVGQRLDRSSQISAVRFLEVKQDGQEVTLAS